MTLRPQRFASIVTITLITGTLAVPAGADWLITLEGRLIETQGPWTIDGGVLSYTDSEGEEHSLSLDDVDLEASEETTAFKAGKPYIPKKTLPPSPEPSADPATAKKSRRVAKVVLYTDAFCPDCRKARELLKELEVEFVEMDLSQSRRAQKKYRKIAGRGGGVPVIDFDGRVVYRFNPRVVRERAAEFLEKEAEADP